MLFRKIGWMVAAASAALWIAAEARSAEQAAAAKIKVLVISNSDHHDYKAFGAFMSDLLAKTGDFELTGPEGPNGHDGLKAENLKKYDLVLLFGSGGDFTDPAQEQGLNQFVRNGGGLVGVHATDFAKKSDVYWELMGGRQQGTGPSTTIRITEEKHPITAGMKDFEIDDETYGNKEFPGAKLVILGLGDRDKQKVPMIWVQEVGKGRVFNATFGHGVRAWNGPHFQRVLTRGLYWSVGREPK